MMGVPANYLFLAQEPASRAPTCRACGARSSAARRCPRRCSRRGSARGVEIVQGYGLTEAAPNVLCLPPEDAARKHGFAGKPYPHVDVALRDPESGALLDGPATGELVVRGPNVFAGYWRDPEATAAAFADGWLLDRRRRRARRRGLLPDRGRLKDCSSRAARTSIRPRSRTCCTSTRPSPTRRSSASPTSAGARSASRSSCSRRREPTRTSCSSTAAGGSRASRCRRRSRSSTSCRAPAMGKVLKDELRAP